MNALEATAEWTELKHSVIAGMLDALPFFGSLVASRRSALAALMSITVFDAGKTVFREGDQGTRFYIMSEGAVEVHKMVGRTAFSGSRVISRIEPTSDRPWFGEVAMWLRKPRQGTAFVAERARMLVVDEMNFDAFLALVPDFRPYLNKSHVQATTHSKQRNISLEQSAAEEARVAEQSAVALRWKSGARLGGKSDELAERSIFAERWERIVTSLLYFNRSAAGADSYSSSVSTVSFRTADYVFDGAKPRASPRP